MVEETRSTKPKFLRALSGEPVWPPPLWLMRQAGRYLPEYRAIRSQAASFLDFCYDPKSTVEATLQPIRRFGFDAAILFSDILVIPDALGQHVSFESGEGPRLTPISDEAGVTRLRETINLDRLYPVFETVSRLKQDLPKDTPLIGFCGAPWTVASYMIAGRGTPDQAPARLFAYRHPALFQRIIDRLVVASIDYLKRQIEAGVDAIQIFDTWAGVLPTGEFDRWCVSPIAAIVAGVKARYPAIPIIVFARGAGPRLLELKDATDADALGIDTSVDPDWAATLPKTTVLQGNLDPLALIAGGEALEEAVTRILAAFRHRPHIFNLGHGILPETPIAHVERLVELVRRDQPF
ncbi:uroporphyrinogen decarboxylase [Beijerinckia sp. L45]|uniref:uroporphyrinogen decarboxylase n=1 Tax=Beijerinckia sp. L45 TaxID=1641855 RepID=UPI00131C784F|nr:uroporphyrinogen decarboxylase [Beijerinckia sp. L45]